jgi:hypothetical protein
VTTHPSVAALWSQSMSSSRWACSRRMEKHFPSSKAEGVQTERGIGNSTGRTLAWASRVKRVRSLDLRERLLCQQPREVSERNPDHQNVTV